MTTLAGLGGLACLAFCLNLVPSEASAQDGDGIYGRLSRDSALELAVGTELQTEDDPSFAIVADLHFRYLDAAGPVVALHWGMSEQALRTAFVGIELRPFWPSLFFLGYDARRAFLDRLLQSVSLELGAAFAQLGRDARVGFGVGMSISVPLLPPRESTLRSLSLRLGSRFFRFRNEYRAAPQASNAQWTVHAAIAMSFSVRTGLGAWEPVRYRVGER